MVRKLKISKLGFDSNTLTLSGFWRVQITIFVLYKIKNTTTSQWIGGMCIRVTYPNMVFFKYLATSLFFCDYLKRELSTKVQTCLQSMDWMLGQCLQFIAQIHGEGLRMLLGINWLHNKHTSKFKKKNVSKCDVDQAYYY